MSKTLKVFCFAVIIFLILLGVSFSQNQSSSGEFEVTKNVLLNLKNNFTANVSVKNNANYNITLTFENSSAIQSLYVPNSSLYLLVINETGDYSKENFILNNSQANFTIQVYCNQTYCFPGKYKGNFIIFNSTNQTENATVEVEVDLPIFTDENGTSFFIGVFPYNSSTYHSLYFNTSSLENATGVTILLIDMTLGNGTEANGTSYLDIFLLDESGNLRAKSLVKEVICENQTECYDIKLLNYKYLPKNEVWEIRVANSTEEVIYAGILTLTTLNITNESEQISEIDFGGLNSTLSLKSTTIDLKNEGQRPLEVLDGPNLISFAYLKRFEGSGPKNFTILIPGGEIANWTEVSLEWKGSSEYSLFVYDPLGNLKGESINKSTSAKVCNVEREEFVKIEQKDLLPGYWKISVINTTSSNDEYNLTVFLYLNSREWVKTNFNSSILNYTNSTAVEINLTLGKTALDGEYIGYINYIHNDYGFGWLTLPIHAYVNTSMLVVNGTFNSSLIKLKENTEFNITKTLNITIENPGSYALILNSTSSGVLKNGTNNITLLFDAPSSIPPNSSGLLNITLIINTLNTSNTPGTYEGWVFLNSSEANPYKAFNLTLQVNLTNELKVKIYDLKTADGDKEVENPNSDENITLIFNVSLVNGTVFESLTKDNFIVLLNHKNVSFSPSFNFTNANFDGNYTANFTLPAKKPGGFYNLTLKTTYKSLKGESTFDYIFINNTALRMTLSSTEFSVYNGTSFLVNVSIDNFGPLNATNAKIKITPGNCLASISFHSGKCEGVSLTGGSEVTFNLSGNKINACYVVWNLTAGTPSDSIASCDSRIEGISETWFWNLTFWTTVSKQTGGGAGGGAQPYYFYNLTFIKAESLIVLKQNSTNSTIVIIKNTGNASQEITFGILNINSSWYKINSTGATLLPNQQVAFLVNFSVGMEEPKDYAGKFRAYSPNKTIISDFTLRILPLLTINESQIREINDTLLIYKVKMLNYSIQINESKQKGYNVSSAEQILLQIEKKIEEAESFVAQGNYTAAQELLPTIQTLLNQLEEELGKITKPEGKGLDWTLIVIVIVAIAGAIILIYLFWPTKTGYIVEKKKYVYKPKREEIKKKLKEKWEEATKRRK
jgi:hypothetical protein